MIIRSSSSSGEGASGQVRPDFRRMAARLRRSVAKRKNGRIPRRPARGGKVGAARPGLCQRIRRRGDATAIHVFSAAQQANAHLQRDPFGQLVLTAADGRVHPGVQPARAFTITAAREGIALLSRDGHEVAWIEQLDDLPEPVRLLVEEQLAGREFMPEILRVSHASAYATSCSWQVQTDRGDTTLLLKTEEDIRRLSGTALLVVDSRGIQFLIRAPQLLDPTSRRILDRFL